MKAGVKDFNKNVRDGKVFQFNQKENPSKDHEHLTFMDTIV